jgi:hypothetical protein
MRVRIEGIEREATQHLGSTTFTLDSGEVVVLEQYHGTDNHWISKVISAPVRVEIKQVTVVEDVEPVKTEESEEDSKKSKKRKTE